MKNSLLIKALLCHIGFSSGQLIANDNLPLETTRTIPAYQSELSSKKLLTDIEKVGNKFFAVGERGHIIYSDNGENWQQANVPINVLLTGLKFVNALTGFAVGHDSTLLKTVDGGLNWTIVNYQPESDKPFLNIAVNGSQVVAVGAYGLFWRSDDQGNSWDSSYQEALLLEDDRLYLQEIKEFEPERYDSEKQFLLPHFNSVTLGENAWYLGGEGGFFAMSSDQGSSWERIETDYYGSYFAISELDPNHILLAGLRGNAFIMSLAGDDWHKLETEVPATINNILRHNEYTFLFANSGNLFIYHNDEVNVKSFADGKAIMDGVLKQNKLVLATEAGIKLFELPKPTEQ